MATEAELKLIVFGSGACCIFLAVLFSVIDLGVAGANEHNDLDDNGRYFYRALAGQVNVEEDSNITIQFQQTTVQENDTESPVEALFWVSWTLWVLVEVGLHVGVCLGVGNLLTSDVKQLTYDIVAFPRMLIALLWLLLAILSTPVQAVAPWMFVFGGILTVYAIGALLCVANASQDFVVTHYRFRHLYACFFLVIALILVIVGLSEPMYSISQDVSQVVPTIDNLSGETNSRLVTNSGFRLQLFAGSQSQNISSSSSRARAHFLSYRCAFDVLDYSYCDVRPDPTMWSDDSCISAAHMSAEHSPYNWMGGVWLKDRLPDAADLDVSRELAVVYTSWSFLFAAMVFWFLSLLLLSGSSMSCCARVLVRFLRRLGAHEDLAYVVRAIVILLLTGLLCGMIGIAVLTDVSSNRDPCTRVAEMDNSGAVHYAESNPDGLDFFFACDPERPLDIGTRARFDEARTYLTAKTNENCSGWFGFAQATSTLVPRSGPNHTLSPGTYPPGTELMLSVAWQPEAGWKLCLSAFTIVVLVVLPLVVVSNPGEQHRLAQGPLIPENTGANMKRFWQRLSAPDPAVAISSVPTAATPLLGRRDPMDNDDNGAAGAAEGPRGGLLSSSGGMARNSLLASGFECSVCFCDIPARMAPVLRLRACECPPTTLVCEVCQARHVQACIEENSLRLPRCPGHCGQSMLLNEVREKAQAVPELLARLERNVFLPEEDGGAGGQFPCASCGEVLQQPTAETGMLRCPQCRNIMCVQHRRKARRWLMTQTYCPDCKQEQQRLEAERQRSSADKKTADFLRSQGAAGITKNCPRCGIVTEKDLGCQHMTCVCGHEYFWCCLRSYRDREDRRRHLQECS